MTRVDNAPSFTQSNANDEVLPRKSCEEVLEKLPPEYAEKASQYPEIKRGIKAEKSDSDSGDSLFITQKPVPQPVRSRRNRFKLHLEEHEYDSSSSSSSSDEPSRPIKKKHSKMYKLPQYSFPFLPGKRRHRDTRTQNASLRDAGIVGFLKFVKELYEGHQTSEDEENISPLPEEEEEGAETEDIKVVERKRFAVRLKPKSQQTPCNQQKNIRKAANAGHEPPQGKQLKASDKEPAPANTLRIAAEENELAARRGNSQQQPETQKTKSRLKEEHEEEDTPRSEQKTTESGATLEVHGDLDSDLVVEVSASSCAGNGGKEKKKADRGGEDEEQLQSRTVPDAQSDEAENWRKKKKRRKEEEIIAEEGRSLAASEETVESSFAQRKKKQSSCDDAAQGGACAGVSSLLALRESKEESAKKRKRRMKTNPEEVNNSPDPVENTNNEDLDTQSKAGEDQISEKVPKRKKRKKRKRESFSENMSEQGSARGDDSVSVQELKRTSSFLRADAERSQSVEAPVAGAENDRNVDESDDGVRKKKKKKKRRKRESCSENISEQVSVRGDDSVSVQERKRTSSFLGADAESSVRAPVAGAEKPSASAPGLEIESAENDRNVEECNDGVRKKKKKDKKRKVLEMHDSVEKDQEQDFEEFNTHQSALSEGMEPGVKRKHEGHERLTPAQSLEGAVDAGPPFKNETLVLKKKKKKSKDKNQTDVNTGGKKEKKNPNPTDHVLFNVTTSAKSVGLEPGNKENKKKKGGSVQTAEENTIPSTPSLSKSESSSSDRTKKNKLFKVKRRILNPSEGFHSDSLG